MRSNFLIIIIILCLFTGCGNNEKSNKLVSSTSDNGQLTYAEKEAQFLKYYTAEPLEGTGPWHGYALVGGLKYGPDFKHFDYVNPDAPKGGELTLSSRTNFDSLHPFIIKGTAAPGIGLLFQTLMTSSNDEPSSHYGLIAESQELAEDRSWTAFNLRKEARWHDGTPVTSDDVVFSFNMLTQNLASITFYQEYYRQVTRVEAEGPNRVVFYFADTSNPELPSIVGQLYILCKHYYDSVPYEEPTEEPPIGSGPYKVLDVNMGKSITYQLDPDFWGRDLPVMKGRYNFGKIRYITYLDENVRFQGFKAGEFDYFYEYISKRWATEYVGDDFENGNIIKELWPDDTPQNIQAYTFNCRKELFQDPKVREAISYAWDFEWSNKNLFYNQYTRSKSYFENSIFASYLGGLPSELELEYLEPLRDMIPEKVFTEVYEPPKTDGTGNNRTNLTKAAELLEEAGWIIEDTKLVNKETGEPFTFEITLVQASIERVIAPFVQNLEKLGITATYRTIDTAQYIERIQTYDYDMKTSVWPVSFSPGNELRKRWGSIGADMEAEENYAGIKDPAVDILIEKVVEAPDLDHLIASARALDRVLLWNHYNILTYYAPIHRIAYWNKFGRPENMAELHPSFLDVYWYDETKDLNKDN